MLSSRIAPRILRLEPQQFYKMSRARGTCIEVRQGSLWLTEAHAGEDHFLFGRQCYRIRHQGLVLLEAADKAPVEFAIKRPAYAWLRLARRAASGVIPVQRLKARWKALGSEKPSR